MKGLGCVCERGSREDFGGGCQYDTKVGWDGHAHASSAICYCCVVDCKYDGGGGSGRIIWLVGVRDTIWVLYKKLFLAFF